jgi:signal peptidase II
MLTLLTASVVLLFDQLTKFWVRNTFSETEGVAVFQGFFNVTYVRNRGGVFGIFPHQQLLFILLSIITIAAIAYFYKNYTPKKRACEVALGLVLGGAVGNLLDRVALDKEGCVTDWLDLHWGAYHWPAFNIADSSICVGVFLLLYFLIMRAETKAKNS